MIQSRRLRLARSWTNQRNVF